MERRSEDGPLKGLWGFPMVGPLGDRKAVGTRAKKVRRSTKKLRVPEKVDLDTVKVHLVGTARHSIMNRRLTLEIYTADAVPSYRETPRGTKRRFASKAEIGKLPRSSIVDKVLRKLSTPGFAAKNRPQRRRASGQASLFDSEAPERKKNPRRRK
jgi:hypothetical protein